MPSNQNKRLVDHTTILMASRAIRMVLALAPGILLARMLTKADYGTYQQIMLIAQFLAIFLPLGLPASLYYFIPKNRSNQRNIIFQTVLTLCSFALIGCLGLFLVKNNLATFFNNPMLERLIYFILAVVFSQVLDRIVDVLILIDKAVTLAVLQIIDGISILLFFVIILYLNGTVKELTAALVVIKMLRLLYIAWDVYRLSSVKSFTFDTGFLKSQLQYSLPLAMATFTLLVGKEIDKAIVGHYLTIEEFAVYGRGAMELPFATIITGSVTSMLAASFVVMLSGEKRDEFIRLWHNAIRLVAVILFPIFVAFSLVADEFITLLYSENYKDSVPIFLVYLCLLPFQVSAFDAIIRYAGKTKIIMILSGVSVVFNIVLSVILINTLGLIGPAVATVISNGLLLQMLYVRYITRIVDVPFRLVLPWRQMGWIMVCSLLSGIVIIVIKSLIQSKLIVIAVGFLLFALVYLTAVWLFGLISESEKCYCKEIVLRFLPFSG